MEQEFAPKLPIGKLEDVLSVHQEWTGPLLTEEERQELKRASEDFARGCGQELAEKLQNFVESLPENKNWMAPAWTEMYLSIRDSLLTESNYALHLAPLPGKEDACDNDVFAARWISAAAAVYRNLKNHPKTVYEEEGRIFCDLNTHNLLGCTRIPAETEDQWKNYPEFLKEIAVFHQNRCFIVPIFDENNQMFSEKQIADLLKSLRRDSAEASCDFLASSFHGSDLCVSFLNDFLKDAENNSSFEQLNKTIFHVVLIDEDFSESKEHCKDIAFTMPHIRWCYKPVTFLIWKNKEISAYMEHTGADGAIMMRILKLMKKHLLQGDFCAKTASQNPPKYSLLSWNYSETQKQALKEYFNRYKKKEAEYSLEIYDFDAGADIFSGVSRDALAQILIQYGMHKITERPRSIYASCSMGHFREGRTEALRTVSFQSQKFVQNLAETRRFDKNLFEEALAEHKKRVKICKKGLAPARYLSGLSRMNTSSVPVDFFNNPLSLRLSENYFSTSNIGTLNDLCSLFLFSPPAPSRYGIGYLTNNQTIRLCISYHVSDQENLRKMLDAFEEFAVLTRNPA